MRVGFIGLGHMGHGMAASLLKAGHDVTTYNRSPGRSADLEAAGAKVAATVAQACGGDAVFTMLSNDEAVQDVVFGVGGILDSLPKGATHVSSSTISIELSDRLAEAHAKAGQRYVAATVLGRPNLAAEGQLFVIVAGADETVEEVAPLLSAVGRQTTRFGIKPSNANMV